MDFGGDCHIEQTPSNALRIAAVIGCTAFEAGEKRPAFVVDFDIGVAEVEPGENAARALERAANKALPLKAG